MSAFCQWLLNEPGNTTPPSAIVLQGDPRVVNDQLVGSIAQYLNEYDDDAEGLWLSAGNELIKRITADPSSRRLLGMKDLASPDLAGSAQERMLTLAELARHGHLVFRAPGQGVRELNNSSLFHAGIGSLDQIQSPCHIIVDPTMMAIPCIPQMIADVFLEWASCNQRLEKRRIEA